MEIPKWPLSDENREVIPPSKNKLLPLSQLLSKTVEEIESFSMDDKPFGISTGYHDLDAFTQGGLQRGDLIILGSRPAMGKTSLALNLARNIARQSLPVCIFSLDESVKLITYRLLSQEVGLETRKLRSGRIEKEEMEFFKEGVNRLGQLPIFINDKITISIEEIVDECQQFKEKQSNSDLGLVVIDFVQDMGDFVSDGPSRDLELAKIARSLKQMAIELNVPLLLISQIDRDVESRENKRPVLRDLRDTHGLETYADIIAMLYRDEYYYPDSEDQDIAELTFYKHRNGPLGTVKLYFDKQFIRFMNI